MEVFHVTKDIIVKQDLFARDPFHDKDITFEDIDQGLYVSVEAAIQAIDKFADQELKTAMQNANEAWVSAYPAEEFVNDCTLIIHRRSIMVYERSSGEYIRSDYYIKKKEVKESA